MGGQFLERGPFIPQFQKHGGIQALRWKKCLWSGDCSLERNPRTETTCGTALRAASVTTATTKGGSPFLRREGGRGVRSAASPWSGPPPRPPPPPPPGRRAPTTPLRHTS